MVTSCSYASFIKSSTSDATASGFSRSALSRSGASNRSINSMAKEFHSSDGRFTLHTRIGAGAFGQVYQATDTVTGQEVAVKLEKQRDKMPSQLDLEYRVYKCLDTTLPGVPFASFKGTDGPFSVMAMELLGPSLEDLLSYCDRKFSLKTVLMLGEQFVRVVRHLHEVGYLHRDLKPENFAMGLGSKANNVYLIDYGLAKGYLDKSGGHIPFRKDKGFTGTARYASLASHQGWEQGRKDDMESLCYVIAYLIDGSLPWQGVPTADRAKRKKLIFEKKLSTEPEALMKKLPCLTGVLDSIKRLKFDAQPDYQGFVKVIDDEFRARGLAKDFDFDWFEASKKYC